MERRNVLQLGYWLNQFEICVESIASVFCFFLTLLPVQSSVMFTVRHSTHAEASQSQRRHDEIKKPLT